jgi:hypothetical protein
MPADPSLTAQVNLILDHLEDAAVYPGDWQNTGEVDYLHRKNVILVHERDEAHVTDALRNIVAEAGGDVPEEDPFQSQHCVGRVRRLTVPPAPALAPEPIHEALNRLDARVGRGKARPEYIIYAAPHPCPATEPIAPPPGTVDPFPPPEWYSHCCRAGRDTPQPVGDGTGVSVVVADTGLIPDAAAGHPWLAGVQGGQEETFSPEDDKIRPYAGHGTFVAGCLRCAAPKASVYVERAYDIAGAVYESSMVTILEDALTRHPDILLFPFITSSRDAHSLHTFDDFYERRIRYVKGLVVVAPAGNEGENRWMWPAAYPWVVSVGALSASWRDRASFSNYGGWVDVYAPGENLVNAFPTGTYVCNETLVPEEREFSGMATWSGTSFSTPIVVGMIAARMSATGENGQQAAESLLRLAGSQAIPGVGPVLYPGQACCEPGHRHHGTGPEWGGAGQG